MIKKTVNKAKKYFDQSKTVKKWGAAAEKVPTSIGNLRKNLADMETESWYGTTGKWTGVSLLIALQALAKSIKILGVDNLMLRTVEIEFSKMNVGKNKKGNDKAFSAFIKKHPWIPAYVVNYMMMAGVLFGANVGGARDKTVEKIKGGVEKIKNILSKEESTPEEKNTDIGIVKRTGAQWCSMDLTNALGVAIPLVFEECYLVAKKTSERGGIYNIGYCMTSMPVDKSKPYGKWRTVKKGDTCTEEQAALWAAVYNQKNIFPTISEKLEVEVTFGMILALTDLSYNSGALGRMIARLNDGWTEQEVLDKMLEYRQAKINGVYQVLDGLVVRRWWDYAAGSNVLDYEKLLDCKLTAVSQVGSRNLYSDKAKYEPIITDEKVESVLTAKVPSRPSVRDIFERSATGKGYIKAIEAMDFGKSKIDKPAQKTGEDSEVIEINNIAFEAQTAFDQGDYVTAETKFKKLIELVPESYDSYNDLIYTLYRMGKYDEALKYARILIDLGHANDVSEDNMFGAAYFNAGLCREAKGELETAKKCYITASKRMPNNKTVKAALAGVEDKLKVPTKQTGTGKKETSAVTQNQNLLKYVKDKIDDKSDKNRYEAIIEATNDIANSGLAPKFRAELWFYRGVAFESIGIRTKDKAFYQKAYYAYAEAYKMSKILTKARDAANKLVKDKKVASKKLLTMNSASDKLQNQLYAQNKSETFDATFMFIDNEGRA